MRKIKTLKSYSALASFIATLKTKPSGKVYIAGYMPFHLLPAKPKYSFSAAWPFYRIDKPGLPCVTWIETSHKTYEIWEAETDAEFNMLLNEADAQREYDRRAA